MSTTGRIMDIVEHGRHLSLESGFVVVSVCGKEIGRVPIDDVASVLISAHGCSYTNPLVSALAERGALLVTCDRRHLPVAWTVPIAAHHAQTKIIGAQINAPGPLKKRIWQYIVKAKIRAQGDALEAAGVDRAIMDALVPQVASGDPRNVEATAAQRYFPALFGRDFRRDREAPGANALLNYGYTIVRSAIARYTVAAGLHPSASVKHLGSPLALADDLMEPFRPVVDIRVLSMIRTGRLGVTRETRVGLAELLDIDVGGTTLSTGMQSFVRMIAQAFLDGKPPHPGGKHVAHGPVRPANDVEGGAPCGVAVSKTSPSARVRANAMVHLHKEVSGSHRDHRQARAVRDSGRGIRSVSGVHR